jgi:hypothetical protein
LRGVESLGEGVDDRYEVVELVLQFGHRGGRVVGRRGLVAQSCGRQFDR